MLGVGGNAGLPRKLTKFINSTCKIPLKNIMTICDICSDSHQWDSWSPRGRLVDASWTPRGQSWVPPGDGSKQFQY